MQLGNIVVTTYLYVVGREHVPALVSTSQYNKRCETLSCAVPVALDGAQIWGRSAIHRSYSDIKNVIDVPGAKSVYLMFLVLCVVLFVCVLVR